MVRPRPRPQDPAPPPVRISIGRLVLDGIAFDRPQTDTFRQAFEAELAALLADGPRPSLLREGSASRQVDGGGLRISPSGDPVQVGRRTARAVYEGFGPAPERRASWPT